jgi:hypothetical protein
MRIATVMLGALLLLGCKEGPDATSFESSRGTITYKERVRPDDGKFEGGSRSATVSEIARLRQSADRAGAFVGKYVASNRVQPDLLANLDTAFAAWLQMDGSKESPAEVESIVGAALGQYCIERLPVRWMVVSDANGTEFALIGENPPSKSFPLASVRYRIEDRKTDFIGALYEALVHVRKKAGGET